MFYCKPYVSVQGYCTVITENGRVTKSKISYIFNNIFGHLKYQVWRDWPEFQCWRPDKTASCRTFWDLLLRGGNHCCRPALAWHQALLLLLVVKLCPQKKPVFTAVLVIIKLNVLDLGTSCARTEDLLGGRTHAQSEENLKCLYEQRVKSPISQDPRQQNQHIGFLSHSLMRMFYRD